MPKPTDHNLWPYMFADDIKFTQKIALINSMGQILSIKRSETAKVRPNTWDLPGGNVLYGENNLDSLLREVHEETNIRISEEPQIIHFAAFQRDTKGYYLFGAGYKARVTNSEITALTLSFEHSEYQWVSQEEFLETNSHWFLREMVRRI